MKRHQAGRRLVAVVGTVLALTLAACSSGGSDEAATTSAPSTTASDTAATSATSAQAQLNASWEAPACDRGVTEAPEVTPVAGSDSDFDLTSFDGTTIRVHWFPAPDVDQTAPTVLMGPGWSLPGDTDVTPDAEPGVQSMLSIGKLHAAGYNVATWDPRGFGESGGTVTIDSAEFEAKDVSALIDWLAGQDGVELDGDGDPRIGMVGMSYGGGIQYVTAATDCRVDVITPAIAWNSLSSSLYPAETFKAGWGELLVSIAADAELDPHIASANADASGTGALGQDDRLWFVDRGPDAVLGDIGIPTLIVQGTVDNLFPLSEGVRNFVALSANQIPLAMTWFCGGHGACANPADPEGFVSDAVMNWLARYLAGDTAAEVVPVFQTVDQLGEVHTFDAFPPAAAGASVHAFATEGTLELQPEGGSGPLTDLPPGDVIGSLAGKITPATATRAFEVPVPVSGDQRLLLGAPRLTLGYTCDLDAPATKPTRMFAQLVDDATGRLLGNQVTPVQIVCDGLLHRADVAMEEIAFVSDGETGLTLQLVATSVAYAEPQMGGSVGFSRVEVTVPTVTG